MSVKFNDCNENNLKNSTGKKMIDGEENLVERRNEQNILLVSQDSQSNKFITIDSIDHTINNAFDFYR